jgi:hypothetical protein
MCVGEVVGDIEGYGVGPVVGTGVIGCCCGYMTGAFTGYLQNPVEEKKRTNS